MSEKFVKPSPMQLTLRVMQDTYTNPNFWIGFTAMIAILTVTGPFSTLESFAFAPRLVYWASISLFTFPMGLASSVFFASLANQTGIPVLLSRLLGGIIGGVPIGAFVFLANKYIIGDNLESIYDLLRLTGYAATISAAVAIIYYLVETERNKRASDPATSTKPKAINTPFFSRLPHELGKDIISLQAQDHYIKVTTTRGSEMILVRLADAEQELENIPGIRVHRSWWVATRHVTKKYRYQGKLMLELSNQTTVPVSRPYRLAVDKLLSEK